MENAGSGNIAMINLPWVTQVTFLHKQMVLVNCTALHCESKETFKNFSVRLRTANA